MFAIFSAKGSENPPVEGCRASDAALSCVVGLLIWMGAKALAAPIRIVMIAVFIVDGSVLEVMRCDEGI